MKKHLLLFALLLRLQPLLNAQSIELVKDISKYDQENFYGLDVLSSATAGGLYFALASDHVYDKINLWRSDGTTAGTYPVTDQNEVIPYPDELDRSIVRLGNTVFFVSSYQRKYYLYQSDGTKTGTRPIHPISRRVEEFSRALVEFNGFIYFSDEVDDTFQLWKTDGTTAGTTLIKTIIKNDFWESEPYDFLVHNGYLYFLTRTDFGEARLWKSDGTMAGTVAGPAFPDRLKVAGLGNYLYFQDKNILKRTDGSTVTIVSQKFDFLYDPVTAGTAIYFSAGKYGQGAELWKSNGTNAGTVQVKDINSVMDEGSGPESLANVNGTLFFSAYTASSGRELWKSNGTAAGTVLVKDLNTSGDSKPREIIAAGTQAAFVADNASGPVLWKTDGTSAGTYTLSNFESTLPVHVNGTVFFNGRQKNKGMQICKSSLVANSAVQITSHSGPSSYASSFFSMNGTVYFRAYDGLTGTGLWKTNGTPGGTLPVKLFTPDKTGMSVEYYTDVNGMMYFVLDDNQLWRSDGTTAGTVLVKTIENKAYSRIRGLVNLNGMLYFGVLSATQDLDIWKSDGTSSGTIPFVTFPNTDGFSPVVYNGALYFGAADGADSYDLWKSNGTAAGTTIVKDISYGKNTALWLPMYGPSIFNGLIYYFAENADGCHLMKSDGTTAGTFIVKTMYPTKEADFASRMKKAGDFLYFTAYSQEGYNEVLWRTDGTNAGTVQLGLFESHYDYYQYFRFQTEAGGLFYFVPFDQLTGDRLWVSDGTPAGTHVVKDFGIQSGNAAIEVVTNVGDIVYYSTSDGENGTELWRTDGTEPGTYMVQDFNPNGSSYFNSIHNHNGVLYLGINNGTIGSELYKYQPKPEMPLATRINSGGSSYLAAGRRVFMADQYVRGTTKVAMSTLEAFTNTVDDQLYREQRAGSAFTYNIPVTNGKMKVILHFAEIYWGVSGPVIRDGTGKRKFNVSIEGSAKLTNYDIYAAAGGPMRARTESFTVNVTDGVLTIGFSSGAADKPAVAAIEVVPVLDIPLSPIADAYVRNAPNDTVNYGSAGTLEIKQGSTANFQRSSYLKFSLASITKVSAAKLRVFGRNVQTVSPVTMTAYGVANDSWTEPGITWTNAPASTGTVLGNVHVSNAAKYYEIDVTAYVQAQLAGDKVAGFYLTDAAGKNTQLSFNSRENADNQPQLLVQIIGNTGSGARIAAEEVSEEITPADSYVYPNAVKEEFKVKVSERHHGRVALRLVNKNGSYRVLVPETAVAAGSTVELNRHSLHLDQGIYLMEINSDNLKEVIKVLVTE